MNSGVVDVSQYSSWKEILLLEEVNRESLANMRKEIQRMLATTKQQKTVSMTIKDGLVLLVELHDVLSANLKKKGPLMEILKTELRFRKDKKDLSKEAQRKAAREAEREADRLKRIQKQAEAEKRKKEAERNKREEEAKQRTERDKRRKQGGHHQQEKRRKRPQALVIKVSETLPYAEVLRKLKLSVKPADTNTEIRAIRKTMGGDVMLEMEPSCGITESFRKSVEDAVGGGLVKDLKPRASLEIRDIDSLTPADEVRAGIERKLGGPREDLTVNLTAPNGRQQILAIVSLAGGDAEKLVK
ncbi:hypothetical protein GE061_004185, partial [Apolygus lucorum]